MTLKVEMNKELEKKFRELAMKRYGYSKGALKKATESAIQKWTEEASVEISSNEKEIRDSLKLIEGGLAHLRGRVTSVEMQHESTKLWAERTLRNKKK